MAGARGVLNTVEADEPAGGVEREAKRLDTHTWRGAAFGEFQSPSLKNMEHNQ